MIMMSRNGRRRPRLMNLTKSPGPGRLPLAPNHHRGRMIIRLGVRAGPTTVPASQWGIMTSRGAVARRVRPARRQSESGDRTRLPLPGYRGRVLSVTETRSGRVVTGVTSGCLLGSPAHKKIAPPQFIQRSRRPQSLVSGHIFDIIRFLQTPI